MAKHKSKRKSGSAKSQTITVIVGSVVIFLLLVLGIKIGLVSWLLNLIFSVVLFVSIIVNSILAYKLFNPSQNNYTILRKDEQTAYLKGKEDQKKIVSHEVNTSKEQNVNRAAKERELLMKKVVERDSKINQLEATIANLEVTVNKLHSKLKLGELNAAPYNKPHDASLAPESVTEKTQEAKSLKPTPRNNSLFFDGPYDDRFFSETNAAQEKRFRYVYRIEYAVAEPSVGKLYLEPTTEEYDILRSYSDTVLKPACAFDNAFYTGFHNISQLAPGTVQKQGNDWYVKEKVKIRFN
jgi:hypothetical protein